MQLALGTVQFGMAYGIAGRGEPVPDREVRGILQAAYARGIRTLDTAPGYGDIEERLASLCGQLPFTIISKIPALPKNVPPKDAISFCISSAEQSRQRLGQMLSGLLFHNSDDLKGEQGLVLWHNVQEWAKRNGVQLGASFYEPQMAATLNSTMHFDFMQLPGNAFDQRVDRNIDGGFEGCAIHLRSAFLQGLLLMPQETARSKFLSATHALDRWHTWCAKSGLSQVEGCLSVVKSFSSVTTVIVGVDTLAQFEEIADAWGRARPISASELSVDDLAIIDPRQWPKP